MQPTIIKIKFTPIIRHLQKDDTNCCLEIVPDVLSIENLDTIEWNENNFLEYSIPITYKIILKRDTHKYAVEEQEKIYYSCVDLRHLSTNSTMRCGNITKVISDNYVLSKVNDYDSRNQNNISRHVRLKEQEFVNFTRDLDKTFLMKPLVTKEDDRNDIKKIDYDILPCPGSTQLCTHCTDAITAISDVRNKKEARRKLTITSVCTLNTIDNPIHEESKKNNRIMHFKYKPNDSDDYKISKYTESFTMYRSVCCDNKFIKKSPRERILPELRVAHFMMAVENEIMPLKILLSEIYTKCASLGLLWKSNELTEASSSIKSTHKSNIKFLNYNETKPKCNRVVYSIVFEE